MHIKHLSAIFLLIALSLISNKTEACTRAVYLGENGLVITGRTMDWKENIPTNLYILPEEYSDRVTTPEIPCVGHQDTAVSWLRVMKWAQAKV